MFGNQSLLFMCRSRAGFLTACVFSEFRRSKFITICRHFTEIITNISNRKVNVYALSRTLCFSLFTLRNSFIVYLIIQFDKRKWFYLSGIQLTCKGFTFCTLFGPKSPNRVIRGTVLSVGFCGRYELWSLSWSFHCPVSDLFALL